MAKQMLKILQVSTADIQGGAEKVAWDLYTRYRTRGHCSWLAVGKKRSVDRNILLIPNQEARGKGYHFFQGLSAHKQPFQGKYSAAAAFSRLAGILSEPIRRLDLYRGIEDFHFPGTARLLKIAGEKPDILHAHNLHGGYFDLRMLPSMSRQLPVFLTLHDAWLLSGHCAHSFDCDRWKTGCGHCPDLTIYPAIQRDATAYNWRRKREIFANSRLYVAAPSRWLMEKVEQSLLSPGIVEANVIPNGVDLEIYHPADRQAARAALGIPQDASVVLTSGVSVSQNRWKDFRTLQEAVARVAAQPELQNFQVIVLGEVAPTANIGQATIRFIPFQEKAQVVASYYQAADLYIHAALADTFPLTVLEAMACGTPVVATAVGGIPEQVQDGQTGFLVPVSDKEAIAARISELLSNQEQRETMGRLAAESAQHKYDLNRQTDLYLDWYNAVLFDGRHH